MLLTDYTIEKPFLQLKELLAQNGSQSYDFLVNLEHNYL